MVQSLAVSKNINANSVAARKALVDRLLLEKISLAGIVRAAQVSERWLQYYVNKKYAAVPRKVHVTAKKKGRLTIEGDEMWSFVQNKDNKQWIWLGKDVDTREIVGVYVGSRQCAVAYTDFWEAYAAIFPATRHRAVGKGSGKTNHIERFNCTILYRFLRSWTTILARFGILSTITMRRFKSLALRHYRILKWGKLCLLLGMGLAYTATENIDICSQHAQVCPVDADSWAGELLGWQTTGKRWQRDINTPVDIEVMWEWSFPYTGNNPDYVNHRENPYADFSDLPDDYPIITGTPATIYDWERWDVVGDNYKLYQFGNNTEARSPFVGDVDCQSGVYFPVVDYDLPYAYTPMYVMREGECVAGGYIASHLVELWGAPLSERRLQLCDNELTGVPAFQSEQGNIICKMSPYVGVVNQRYVQGASSHTDNESLLGCEYATYAWGWERPQGVTLLGQDYAQWFRNGELRLTRWLNLSEQTAGTPAPDDHAWWNTQCEAAWSQKTNWLYDGVYRVGENIYHDTLELPATVSTVITPSGGYLTSTLDSTYYYFPPNTFTATVIVTHTIHSQSALDFYGDVVVPIDPGSVTFLLGDWLTGIGHFFELTAVYSDTRSLAQFIQPSVVTIHYTDAEAYSVNEETLRLYYQNLATWLSPPSSQVLVAGNIITAQINQATLWGVWGRTYRVYLPLLLK